MYSRVCSLVLGSCQRVFEGLSPSGRTVVRNVGFHRLLSCSAVRFQEADSQPVISEPAADKKVKNYLPPLPGEDSPLRWDNKMFEELPIANIKATHNNTHIHFTDCAGVHISRTSCGAEGFKNAKKSSTIAAQVTGIAAAKKAKLNGINFVRVLVKGLGPGRLSAIKGLSIGGLEIVSITDNTPVPHNGCRPRKARRI